MSTSDFVLDPTIRNQYASKLPMFNRLVQEADFVLRETISKAGIKIHSQTYRIKELESFVAKAQRKESKKPFEEIQRYCRFARDMSIHI